MRLETILQCSCTASVRRCFFSAICSLAQWTGNEYYANGDWRRLFNVSSQLMGFARSYQSFRWGRFMPFTTALIDATPTVRLLCLYPTLNSRFDCKFVPAINSYKDVVDVMSLNAGYRFTWCAHVRLSVIFPTLTTLS